MNRRAKAIQAIENITDEEKKQKENEKEISNTNNTDVKMVDFNGYEKYMAFTGLKYVFENEWIDFNSDLLVIAGNKDDDYAVKLRDDMLNHLKFDYNPPIQCHVVQDEDEHENNNVSLLISNENIKKWILHQSLGASLAFTNQQKQQNFK